MVASARKGPKGMRAPRPFCLSSKIGSCASSASSSFRSSGESAASSFSIASRSFFTASGSAISPWKNITSPAAIEPCTAPAMSAKNAPATPNHAPAIMTSFASPSAIPVRLRIFR